MDVFERFVRDFEGKINQLRLVEMGVKVSKEIDSASLLTADVRLRGRSCFRKIHKRTCSS